MSPKKKVTKKKQEVKRESPRGGPRPIWRGNVNFGLVNFPVGLYPAETPDDLDLTMLDRRDLSPIGYETVNKSSGKPVDRSEIVKGYEVQEGQFVVVTEEDLQKANVEATQTVDIVAFVDAKEIAPALFDRPYYLAPLKGGEKPYALLREALRQTGRVGIAKVVIRTRQYIAALYPMDRVLVLDLLRYAHELRPQKNLQLPEQSLASQGLTKREIEMAIRLVEEMVEPWKPEAYVDEYRRDLLEMIEHKAATGEVRAPEGKPKSAAAQGKVIDLMSLLKESLGRRAKATSAGEPERRRPQKKTGPRSAASEPKRKSTSR